MDIQANQSIIQIKGGFVTDMATYPTIKNCIVATLSTGEISFVRLDPFVHLNSIKVFKQYATALKPLEDGLCVGSKNGNFAYINSSYETTIIKKLHDDCISSIIESYQHIITVSYDGKIKFLNKDNLCVEKSLVFQQPIFKAFYFDNCIYTTGNPSFRISCKSFEVKEIKRFDYFAQFNNRLYGCSDQRGLTCVTSNSNSYIPCNFILPLKQKMIIVSDECIGELFHTDHMQWKCYRRKQIKVGTSFVGGCAANQSLILADQDGKIYKITFDSQRIETDCSEKQDSIS